MATLQNWRSHCLSAPRPLRRWLTDRGSLTRRLTSHCGRFRVQVLRQQLGKTHADETRLLGLATHQHGLLRDVLLLCNDQPAVYAHTALPAASTRGPWQALGKLGNRPLGAVLFGNPQIRRGIMQYCKLDRRHPLYRHIRHSLGPQPATLWARRSLFLRDNTPLLVTEVFLTDLP